ncbi:Feruloyl esterase B [Methylobacterium sp. ME121]|nr:Feruloyl esterase B [Methylobacterium sp. ME121]GEN01111.1 hypothetical protein MRA01_56500 [Methylobacterium radiotolerans]
MKNEGLPQVDAWQRGPVIPHVSRVHPDSPPVSRRPERLYTVVCRGGVRFDAGAAGSGRRGRSFRINPDTRAAGRFLPSQNGGLPYQNVARGPDCGSPAIVR